LSGPATVWFGVGFGAKAMPDFPWAIVVDGSGGVSERKLGDHAAGTLLQPSVKVVSNVVDAGVRTVVLSRPLKGSGPDYYTFNATAADASIPFINAIGSGPDLAYHRSKAPSLLTLIPSGTGSAGACVCPQDPKPFGQATGSLLYNRVPAQPADVGDGAVGFGANKCLASPQSVLMEQKNPTCDIRTYVGGQWACHHMWSLLDADQEIPWADKPLVLYHKYRFWVQPYNPTYHTPLTVGYMKGADDVYLIGSPWEFDVPKCSNDVPGCSFANGTWLHTIHGSMYGQHRFVTLNFHCHAPTCLKTELYVCAKGTALKDCNATVGELVCRQQPLYGGTGNPSEKGTRFDEPGYIAIPDCFWGPSEYGLEPPIDLTGLPLYEVKVSNATWGHHGEMAGGQPWVL
jgi:hypothetical protein